MTSFQTITFHVEGEPKPQPRARATTRGAKPGRARVYNPADADQWKAFVGAAARRYAPAEPLDVPVTVELRFYFSRPAKLNRAASPGEPIRHAVNPDADNCEKAVLDVLTNLGFWTDDGRVSDLITRKRYVEKGGMPGLVVSILAAD